MLKEKHKSLSNKFLNMLFGLNIAMRVLPKLLRSTLKKWRKKGIPVFIHVYNGIGIKSGSEIMLLASRRIKRDLGKYRFREVIVGCKGTIKWTGFIWDTKKFKLLCQRTS